MKLNLIRYTVPFALLAFTFGVYGQRAVTLKVTPEEVKLTAGQSVQLEVVATDEDGKEIEDVPIRFYGRRAQCVEVSDEGLVKAVSPGTGRIIVISARTDQYAFARFNVPITVEYAGVAKVELGNPVSEMYANTIVNFKAKVFDKNDFERNDLDVKFTSDNPLVAEFDTFNNLMAKKKGVITVTAEAGGIKVTHKININANPITSITLESDEAEVRTGDVIHFQSKAFDKEGKEVTDLPVTYTYTGISDDVSNSAEGIIKNDGRFVAYQAGMYTIVVSGGGVTAQKTVRVTQRNVTKNIELIGRGSVTNVHTSDLWVWEGVDGKDYAVTGTWGANGEAFFWDVTDPANMQLIDTITVDARTVNDVKVSEDGKVCVISREGASNRKNGLVVLDVTNPREVKQLSTFNEGLTGGVHNVFIYKKHVFALSNGERYDIINIEDPKKPYKVSSFELNTPGHAIHDVWVMDGIAYSSNWDDGVYLVDVGNGIAGGSLQNPVPFANYAYPSGWNHAAFPFKSPSTDKFYVIAGDEAFPTGIHVEDKPTIPAGYLHFVDFTDMSNPDEIAKYEVPGAGSHNFWVDGEVLYVANYNAGLRVVDISGDLLGDLYKQGREIATYLPTDSKGKIPNAAMTWGPQPHKGYVFFSDWNSGLWAAKVDLEQPVKLIDK